MADDLERLFGALASTLPSVPDADADPDEVVLSASNVARCDDVLSTDRIVIHRARHLTQAIMGDRVVVNLATRATCRMLGLLVLSVLLHAEPATVELRLTNRRSKVRRLRVRYPHVTERRDVLGRSYWAVPTLLAYVPDEVHRHPCPPPGNDLVTVALTDEREVEGIDELFFRPGAVSARDTVTWDGSDRALVWLAELLLNAGADVAPDEIDLEGPENFGGVKAHSAEMTLRLPGSIGWIGSDFAT